jgi:UDP-N-acetyl-2-amino-2-deoxyglucuronate dehydrogenase
MAFSHELHRAVLTDFARAVQTRSPPSASGHAALAVHRLIDALLASARSRTFVPLNS